MLNRLKKLSTGGLIIIGLLFIVAVAAMLFAAPKLAYALTALPFVFGAVKVRDDLHAVRTISYTHTSATTKDTIYVLNGMVMLALNSALANAENVYVIAGHIEYTKLSTDVWSAYDFVYWDTTNSRFTIVYSEAHILAGIAFEAAANGTTTGHVLLIPGFESRCLNTKTVTTITTAGPVTYSAVELLGGMVLRDPTGADRSDYTATAAAIIAAIPGAITGSAFEFTIRNTADAAENIILNAGSGVTFSGTMTIAQNNSRRFFAVVTSSSAVSIYSLGTVVH